MGAHSSDENSEAPEKSMGQIWDEWDIDSSTDSEPEDTPLNVQNLPADGPVREFKVSTTDPISSSNRLILGYNRNGRLSKLLVRSADDPDVARIFVKPPDKKNNYYCPCLNLLELSTDNEEMIFRGNPDEHGRLCKGTSFKKLFFELKQSILVHGKREEIEIFENATHSVCAEPGFSRVDQRDWSFIGSKRGQNLEKNTVIIVREMDDTSLCRRYVVERAGEKDGQLLYSCSSCSGPLKANLIVDSLPSGLHNVFRPPIDRHSISCQSLSVEALAAEYDVCIEYDSKMDILSRMPESDYSFLSSNSGREIHRLVVKNPTAKAICTVYTKYTDSAPSGIRFKCTGCPLLAYYINADGRVIAPTVNHCIQRLYKDVMKQGKIFGSSKPNATPSRNLSMLPVVPEDRVKMNEHQSAMVIVNIYNKRFGYKFVESNESRKTDNNTRTFNCINCAAVATVEEHEFGELVVRNDTKHDAACLPISSDKWMLQVLEEPEESRLSINDSEVFEANATGDDEFLNDSPETTGSHVHSTAPKVKDIPRNRWMFEFKNVGKNRNLVIRSADDPDTCTLYVSKCGSLKVFRCSCKKKMIYTNVNGRESVIGDDTMHAPECKPVSFWAFFGEQERRSLIYGTSTEIEEFARVADLYFGEWKSEKNSCFQKYEIISNDNWGLGYSRFGTKDNKLTIKTTMDNNYCYEFRRASAGNHNRKHSAFVCNICHKAYAYLITSDSQKVVNLIGPHADGCRPKLYVDVAANQTEYNFRANSRSAHSKENDPFDFDESLEDASENRVYDASMDFEETISTKCATPSNADVSSGVSSTDVAVISQNRWIIGYGQSYANKCLLKSSENSEFGRIYSAKESKLDEFYCKCRQQLMLTEIDGQRQLYGDEEEHDPNCGEKEIWPLLYDLQKSTFIKGTDAEVNEFQARTEEHFDKTNRRQEKMNYCFVAKSDWDYETSCTGLENHKVIVRFAPNLYYEYAILQPNRKSAVKSFKCCNCGSTPGKLYVTAHNPPRVIAPGLVHSEHCQPISIEKIRERQNLYKENPINYRWKSKSKQRHETDVMETDISTATLADDSVGNVGFEVENDGQRETVAVEPNCVVGAVETVIDRTRWIIGYNNFGHAVKLLVKSDENSELGRMYTSKKPELDVFSCDCKHVLTATSVDGQEKLTGCKHEHVPSCKEENIWMLLCELQKNTFIKGTDADVVKFQNCMAKYFDANNKHKENVNYCIVDKSDWKDGLSPTGQKGGRLIIKLTALGDQISAYREYRKVGLKYGSKIKNAFVCCKCGTDAGYVYMTTDDPARIVAPGLVHSDECQPCSLKDIQQKQEQFERHPKINYRLKSTGQTSVGANHSESDVSMASFHDDSRTNLTTTLSKKRPNQSFSTDIENDAIVESNPPKRNRIEGTPNSSTDKLQENDVGHSVDLVGIANAPPATAAQQLKNKLFIRPSDVWLAKRSSLFGVASSKAAYRVWAVLADVDLHSPDFPDLQNVKRFSNGFSLISYLCTGSEGHASMVKDKIGMFLFDGYKTLGIVDNVDCSKLSQSDFRVSLFAAEMNPYHFAAVSKMFSCTVIVYNYVKQTRFWIESEVTDAPTIVVGQDSEGYFLIVDD